MTEIQSRLEPLGNPSIQNHVTWKAVGLHTMSSPPTIFLYRSDMSRRPSMIYFTYDQHEVFVVHDSSPYVQLLD